MISDSWDIKPLADLVDETIGGLWGNSPESNKPGEDDVIVIRGADFKDWSSRGVADAAPRRVPSRAIRQRRLAPGDLVLEVSGGSPSQPVGRVLVIDRRIITQTVKPLITSNFCRKLRLKPGIDPYFVKSQLDWLYASGHTNNFQTSTTNIRNLQVEDFLNGTEIALPSLMEQRKIVSVINEVEKKRSDSINHLQRSQNVIGLFRQAILAAACSGRLTQDWRETLDTDELTIAPIEIARQRRKSQSKHKFREPQLNYHADFSDLPSQWQAVPLGLLLENLQYGTSKRSEYEIDGVPVLRIPNVSSGQLSLADLKFTKLDKREAESLALGPSDLLMIRSNGSPQLLGRTVLVIEEAFGMAYAGYLIRLRADTAVVNPEYLILALAAPQMRTQIEMPVRSTSGVHNINSEEVRGLVVPLPSLREQNDIVQRVKQLLIIADTVDRRLQIAKRNIDRSSHAVLAKAFQGELSATTNEEQNAELVMQSTGK